MAVIYSYEDKQDSSRPRGRACHHSECSMDGITESTTDGN